LLPDCASRASSTSSASVGGASASGFGCTDWTRAPGHCDKLTARFVADPVTALRNRSRASAPKDAPCSGVAAGPRRSGTPRLHPEVGESMSQWGDSVADDALVAATLRDEESPLREYRRTDLLAARTVTRRPPRPRAEWRF
jgi:hypothetical protein